MSSGVQRTAILKRNLMKNLAIESMFLRGQHTQSANEVSQASSEELEKKEQSFSVQNYKIKDPNNIKTEEVYEDGPSLMDTLWRSKKDYWPLPVGSQNRTKFPGDDPHSNNLL